ARPLGAPPLPAAAAKVRPVGPGVPGIAGARRRRAGVAASGQGGRAMSQQPEPAIRVHVDPTNPGQFFACCGLLELADRLWGGAEGWFVGREFCVACGGTLQPLLAALVAAVPEEVTRLDNGLEVKRLLAPLRLRFE